MHILNAELQNLEQEMGIRKRIRTNLLEWAVHALAPLEQIPAAHHELLLRELETVSRGQVDRLMIQMPPGSAKSTFASTLFPVWWFSQHPGSSVIAASHTASLARHFSKRVRDLIATEEPRLGYHLVKGDRASPHWRLSNGSEYFAAGTRGSIVGRRADLVILDDPIGNQMQADRLGDRDRLWDWYRSDLTTRLKPNGRVILIMTRWHEDDLAGRLADQPEGGWRVLRLPALAEENDPLNRSIGEPLWPEWEDLAALARKRVQVGERTWSAMFQQSPRPPEGGLFRLTKLLPEDSPPSDGAATVRAWDLAATDLATGSNPDWTAGVKLRLVRPGRYVVLDVVRLRGSPWEVEKAIFAAAEADGRAVHIGLPEDPGQAGKAQSSYLTGLLAGYHVVTTRETGSKYLRAQPLASQVEAGNVAFVRGPWNRAFLDELRDFPHGGKDDQVDAFVRAFGTLNSVGSPSRSLKIAFLSR